MLEAVLRALNNWFECDALSGEFRIEGGAIALPEGFLMYGQRFRIVGSVFNDGLHEWPATDLVDEEFDGQVLALAVPKAVVELSEDVAAWEQANGDAARSPMQSESFGGYSYSKGGSSSECPSWREAFRGELGRWRKL